MRSKAKWALALALCVVGAASPAPQQWTPDCDVLRDVYLAAQLRAKILNLKEWTLIGDGNVSEQVVMEAGRAGQAAYDVSWEYYQRCPDERNYVDSVMTR